MYTASLRNSRPVTVLGTVMSVVREDPWFYHRVEATGPDGRRIHIDVVARTRHTGSVMVRLDPDGMAEPRFVKPRPWGLWVLGVLVVIIAVVVVLVVL